MREIAAIGGKIQVDPQAFVLSRAGQLFFEKVELHFELSDLLEQGHLPAVWCAPRKQIRQLLHRLLLLAGDAEGLRDPRGRPVALYDLIATFAFRLGA